MDTHKSISRRAWLRKTCLYGLLGTTFGALGTVLAEVWLAAGHFTSAHWSAIAAADEFSGDGTVPFPDKRVAIIRRGDRLGAISLECTHLGCLVNAVDQGFFCPCHGSEFGPFGEVYSGPAPSALRWHPLQLRQGRIWIHTGRKLDAPQWVSLPGRGAGVQRG